MKIDLKSIKVTSLDGTLLKANAGKALANIIYEKTSTLDWLDIAQGLNREEVVEVSIESIKAIIALIKSDQCGLILAVKRPLLIYLEGLNLEQIQQEK